MDLFPDLLSETNDDRALDDLRATLARRAQEEGLLDVAYRTLDSPVGRLLLAATPEGLVRVAFETEDVDSVLSELAARAGSPRAVRAVGTACALNPVPLVVPCHRVVRSDGTSGGYRGGPEVKRRLLAMEAAA